MSLRALIPTAKCLRSGTVSVIVALCFSLSSLHSQNLTGALAPDFTLPVWGDSQTVSLSDYEGHIIVLDFFAYWCGPCQTSSPDLETNVQKHYEALGGTPEGIPVQVIAVNIEDRNPSSTDTFIANAGLELVLNDSASRTAYNHYSTGGIPLFVIINGVAGSPSHQQWEILYHQAGYSGSSFFRSVIEQVEAPAMDPSDPPAFNLEPPPSMAGMLGDELTVQSQGRAPGSFTYSWIRLSDGAVVGTGPNLVIENLSPTDAGNYKVILENENGQTHSQPCEVFVTLPPSAVSFGAIGLPATIPEDSLFHEYTLTVQPPSAPDQVGSLKIDLDISHTYVGDLIIELVSPSGTVVRLRNNEGGSADDIVLFGEPVAGFSGELATGTWTLRIADVYPADQGTLNAWSLRFGGETTSFGEWASAEGYPPGTPPSYKPQPTGASLLEQYALPGLGQDGLNIQTSSAGVEVLFTQPSDRTDVQYLIEVSQDMQNWSTLDYMLTHSTPESSEASTDVLAWEAAAFFRLRLSHVPD